MFTLPQRQVITIYVGLFWMIPLALTNPFRSLYLVSLGLSNTEVGLYSVMFIPFGLVCLWVSGYLTDIWGRKKTLFLFDTISWGGFCVCLTFARDKWWGVAALFFIALNLGSGPPYQCLIIEGVPAAKRAVIYAVLQITNQAPALLFIPLLAGFWVHHKGLPLACHELFGLFTVLLIIGIAIRLIYLKDSGTFERIPPTWKHGLKEGLEQYATTFKNLFKKPATLTFLGSKLLDEWILSTWAIYASLYFVQHLGITPSWLSLLAPVTAYVACFFLFFFTPRISPRGMVKLLGLDQVFGLAAFAILLIPVGGWMNPLAICLISVGLTALGGSFYGSVSSALWMNIIGEKERAKVVACSTTIFQIGVWVLGSLSAFLYGHVSPAALILFMMTARIVDFILLRKVKRMLEPTFISTKD